ncbi:MAG: CAP domain-containing protein [Pseudomonadota bacterium]|nr:CAP domain-containing protein [Pseudomonadota bacterium]
MNRSTVARNGPDMHPITIHSTFLTRRAALVRLGALAGAAALSGCAGLLSDEAGSSHAGRRPGEVVPLDFDPGQGLSAVNATRRRHLLGAFAHDPRLQQAAQNHADLMARTGEFGHEFGPGTQFPLRMAAVGFDGSAGENLGVGYGSVEEAIEGWLDSPKHREILLRRRYDLAGIAYAFNHSGKHPRRTHFWVLIVGKAPPPGMRLGPYVRRV